MVRNLVRGLLTLALLALVSAAATFLYVAWQINRTGARDSAQQADTIVILGARVDASGQPGPDLRARTLHAVNLFRQGLARTIICTGGHRGDPLSAASVARSLALSRGVPTTRILVADGSMTTREDALRATAIMGDRGWRSAILVSHPLHLERAQLLFESRGISVFPSPTSTDLRAIPWQTRAWLTAREAVGIVWLGLEQLGVPYEWAQGLSRWVYGQKPTAFVH